MSKKLNNKRLTLTLLSALLTIFVATTSQANSWELNKLPNEIQLTGTNSQLNTVISLVCYPQRAAIVTTGTGYEFGHYKAGYHWVNDKKASGLLKANVTDSGAALDVYFDSIDATPMQLLLSGIMQGNYIDLFFATQNGALVRRLGTQNGAEHIKEFVSACRHL